MNEQLERHAAHFAKQRLTLYVHTNHSLRNVWEHLGQMNKPQGMRYILNLKQHVTMYLSQFLDSLKVANPSFIIRGK